MTGCVAGVILVLVGLDVAVEIVTLFDEANDEDVETADVGIMDTLLCEGGSEIGLKLALLVLLVGKRLTLLLRLPLA